jgi:hypothetical protein
MERIRTLYPDTPGNLGEEKKNQKPIHLLNDHVPTTTLSFVEILSRNHSAPHLAASESRIRLH